MPVEALPQVLGSDDERIAAGQAADSGTRQEDATRLAVRAQELAGLDIVTDGEIRRESVNPDIAVGALDRDPGSHPDRS